MKGVSLVLRLDLSFYPLEFGFLFDIIFIEVIFCLDYRLFFIFTAEGISAEE